jgi:hypothetical protein
LFYDPANGSPYELWMDELIVASAPVGCAK